MFECLALQNFTFGFRVCGLVNLMKEQRVRQKCDFRVYFFCFCSVTAFTLPAPLRIRKTVENFNIITLKIVQNLIVSQFFNSLFRDFYSTVSAHVWKVSFIILFQLHCITFLMRVNNVIVSVFFVIS